MLDHLAVQFIMYLFIHNQHPKLIELHLYAKICHWDQNQLFVQWNSRHKMYITDLAELDARKAIFIKIIHSYASNKPHCICIDMGVIYEETKQINFTTQLCMSIK